MDLTLALIPVVPLLYFAWETSRRKKGQKSAVAVALLAFVATLSMWVPYMRRPRLAWDFPGQYVAARLPLHLIHDHQAAVSYWRHYLVPLGIDYCPPYIRPAAFALPTRPLGYLKFWPAFWVWSSVCLLAYFGFIFLLYRKWPLPISILPAFAAFTPAVYGTIQGQDIAAVGLVLESGVVLLLSGWPVLGGVLLGLCSYKFNLILLIPFALLVQKQWRCLLGFCGSASLAAATSLAITPFSQYVSLLRGNWRLATNPQFEGLKLLLFMGHVLPAYVPVAILLGAWCVYHLRKLDLGYSLGLAVAAGVFLSPQSAWYDLTVLLLPIAMSWEFCSERVQFAIFALMCATPLWLLAGKPCEIAFTILAIVVILRARGSESHPQAGLSDARAGGASACVVNRNSSSLY